MQEAIPVLMDARRSEQHLVPREPAGRAHYFLSCLGSMERRHSGPMDDWMATCKRLASLLSVETMLADQGDSRIYVNVTARSKALEFATAMAERCLDSPLFSRDAKLRLVFVAVTERHNRLACLLAADLGASSLLEVQEGNLKRTLAIGGSFGNPCSALEKAMQPGCTAFAPLSAMLSDDELLKARGSTNASFLHTAYADGCWEAMITLLDRLPEMAALEDQRGVPAIAQPVGRPPPLELYRRLVQATPPELLLRQGIGGGTALHRAVNLFAPGYVEALLQHMPVKGRAIANNNGLTALDIAEQRYDGTIRHRRLAQATGEYESRPYQADGLPIIEMLAVGRMTKAAT